MSKMTVRTKGASSVRDTKAMSKRKYYRYKEAAEYYGMGMTKFQQLAKEAKAVIKYDGVVLVDIEMVSKYLETFRL